MKNAGGLDHDIEQLSFSQFTDGEVREKSNGQKVLTVSSGCDIEPGEQVVAIRESLFQKMCEALGIAEDIDI